jgi:hypothetical protein
MKRELLKSYKTSFTFGGDNHFYFLKRHFENFHKGVGTTDQDQPCSKKSQRHSDQINNNNIEISSNDVDINIDIGKIEKILNEKYLKSINQIIYEPNRPANKFSRKKHDGFYKDGDHALFC